MHNLSDNVAKIPQILQHLFMTGSRCVVGCRGGLEWSPSQQPVVQWISTCPHTPLIVSPSAWGERIEPTSGQLCDSLGAIHLHRPWCSHKTFMTTWVLVLVLGLSQATRFEMANCARTHGQ